MSTVKYSQLSESLDALRLVAREKLPKEVADRVATTRLLFVQELRKYAAGRDTIITEFGTPNSAGVPTISPEKPNWLTALDQLEKLNETEITVDLGIPRSVLDQVYADPPAGYSEILFALDWLLE